MSGSEKINIENKESYNDNIKNINNNEEVFKLDFNFDILNEPLPDFCNQENSNNTFLNNKKFGYKRKYNEIQNDNNICTFKPTFKYK